MTNLISNDSRRIRAASRSAFLVGIGIAAFSLLGATQGIDVSSTSQCCGELFYSGFFTVMSLLLSLNRVYLYFTLLASVVTAIPFIGDAVENWPPSSRYPGNFVHPALLAILFGLLSVAIFSARKVVPKPREDLRRGFEPAIPFAERLNAQDRGQAGIESTDKGSQDQRPATREGGKA